MLRCVCSPELEVAYKEANLIKLIEYLYKLLNNNNICLYFKNLKYNYKMK